MATHPIDITGQKFNRLTAIEYVKGTQKKGEKVKLAYWICVCECGNVIKVNIKSLRNGNTKSCGCLRDEFYKSGCGFKTHGMSKKSSEYATWMGMKQRCNNHKNPKYDDYGGRGIKVCEEWENSFEQFYKDMGKKPTPKHSLDRFPDNNGNYAPSNCRWATQKEQTNNTRRNVVLEIDGQIRSLDEWSKELKIDYRTLNARVKRNMSKEQLTEKGNLLNVYFTYLGQTLTSGEWRSRLNIGNRSFYRKRKKMSAEAIIQQHLKEEYRNLVF